MSDVIRPGATLGNGAIVVACHAQEVDVLADPEDKPLVSYVVLAMWLRGRNDCEYVTWVANAEDCFWGHYFEDDEVAQAVADYLLRAGLAERQEA